MSKDFKKKNSEEAADFSAQPTEPAVAYKDWFSIRLGEHRKLQAHHFEPILIFFKHQNLTEMEPASSYDAALKVFGF